MHKEAVDWITETAYKLKLSWLSTGENKKALDVGGRNVNGCMRTVFPRYDFDVCDRNPDAKTNLKFDWLGAEALQHIATHSYNLVVCFEVLEHVQKQHQVEFLDRLLLSLEPGGYLMMTFATRNRVPHNCNGSQPCTEDYDNVEVATLEAISEDTAIAEFHMEAHYGRGDMYLWARKSA